MDDSPERDVHDAERDMDRTADRMEDQRDRLEDDIVESRKELDEMRRATGARDVAGDWHDTHDHAGGDDPKGAAQDADAPAPE